MLIRYLEWGRQFSLLSYIHFFVYLPLGGESLWLDPLSDVGIYMIASDGLREGSDLGLIWDVALSL